MYRRGVSGCVRGDMSYEQCAMCCVLCAMCELCAMSYVLWAASYVPWAMSYMLRAMGYMLFAMCYVPWPVYDIIKCATLNFSGLFNVFLMLKYCNEGTQGTMSEARASFDMLPYLMTQTWDYPPDTPLHWYTHLTHPWHAHLTHPWHAHLTHSFHGWAWWVVCAALCSKGF